jgi:hypothetical protein
MIAVSQSGHGAQEASATISEAINQQFSPPFYSSGRQMLPVPENSDEQIHE